jgi:hypothetical protein
VSVVIARIDSDEAIFDARWIASRSLSSDAHSRDPLARNDELIFRSCLKLNPGNHPTRQFGQPALCLTTKFGHVSLRNKE